MAKHWTDACWEKYEGPADYIIVSAYDIEWQDRPRLSDVIVAPSGQEFSLYGIMFGNVILERIGEGGQDETA